MRNNFVKLLSNNNLSYYTIDGDSRAPDKVIEILKLKHCL